MVIRRAGDSRGENAGLQIWPSCNAVCLVSLRKPRPCPADSCIAWGGLLLVAGDYGRATRGTEACQQQPAAVVRPTDLREVTMAQAKQKTTSKEWRRPSYEEKPLERTTSTAPAWAWGCELCNFGTVKGTTNEYCTCQAGQARARWASGNMAPLEDEIRVPTFNAAYGGGA